MTGDSVASSPRCYHSISRTRRNVTRRGRWSFTAAVALWGHRRCKGNCLFPVSLPGDNRQTSGWLYLHFSVYIRAAQTFFLTRPKLKFNGCSWARNKIKAPFCQLKKRSRWKLKTKKKKVKFSTFCLVSIEVLSLFWLFYNCIIMTLYLIIDFYLILMISTFYLISCRFFSNKYHFYLNLDFSLILILQLNFSVDFFIS